MSDSKLFKSVTVLGPDEMKTLVGALNFNKVTCALDLETTGLDQHKDKILSGAIYWGPCVYQFTANLVPYLGELACTVVGHNIISFDKKMLFRAGVSLEKCMLQDTMLMHHLVDETAEHGLGAIVLQLFGDNYKAEFWGKYKTFEEAPEQEQLGYVGKDVYYTLQVYERLREEIKANGQEKLSDTIHKLALHLGETETQGVCVDLDYLVKVGEDLQTKIATAHVGMRASCPLEVEIVEVNDWLAKMEKLKTPKGKARVKKDEFNWDSTKQLSQLIYGELGIEPVLKWSKAKRERVPTLEDDALDMIKDAHPLIPILRQHRENQKVYGSFIEGTLQRQIGGRIFPHFNINGTVTGRISGSDPNLQQLPKEGGIRGIYIPESGSKLIACDYGQLEVVVAAHYSQDPSLLKIIYEGASKHDITAAGLGVARDKAKTINFAMQYGATEYKIMKILDCSIGDARLALNKYWETYAGEKKVVDECRAKVDRGEPIISIFGRRRHFPQEFENQKAKERAYRQAYSSLVQGTGSDLTHSAFVEFAQFMLQHDIGRALFEVHDEILAEVRDDSLDLASACVALESTMIKAGTKIGLKVPLTVSCSSHMSRWSK